MNVYTDSSSCLSTIRTDYTNQILFNKQEFVIFVNLHGLDIKGSISTHITMLTSLFHLDLGHNDFTDTISIEFGKMTALTTLLMNSNKLHGTIPTQLGLLTALQILDLSYNKLTGCLPSELSSLQTVNSDLDITYSHNPDFCPSSASSRDSAGTSINVIVGISVGCAVIILCLLFGIFCYYKNFNRKKKVTDINEFNAHDGWDTNAYNSSRNNNTNIDSFPNIMLTPRNNPSKLSTRTEDNSVKSSAQRQSDRLVLQDIESGDTRLPYGNANLLFQDSPLTMKRRVPLINEDVVCFKWTDISIDLSDPNIIVGQGSFGQVIRAQLVAKDVMGRLITTEETVIKVIKQRGNYNATWYEDAVKSAVKEMKVHLSTEKKITNKNCIVKVYGLVESELPDTFQRILNSFDAVGIVMRYEAGGTLSSHIHNKDKDKFGNLSLIDKIRILHKFATALNTLHKAGVIHADIKPDNILLSSKDFSQAEVRLADFGLAEIRSVDHDHGNTSLKETKHERGTPKYSAPEQLFDPFKNNAEVFAKPSEKTDMYSFSIVSWEVLSQQEPFAEAKSHMEFNVKVHQGVRPDINMLPKDCPRTIINMIQNCWDADRSKRKPASECVKVLRTCYDQLTTVMPYDIYISYREDSCYFPLIDALRNRLIENGFNVAWMHDIEATTETGVQMNNNIKISKQFSTFSYLEKRKALISQSKLVLACLDVLYQNDGACIDELQHNRARKTARPVIPLFLEHRKFNFPDNEIKVHCQMAASMIQIFDISTIACNYDSSSNVLRDGVTNERPLTSVTTEHQVLLNLEVDKLSLCIKDRTNLFGAYIDNCQQRDGDWKLTRAPELI